MDAFCYGAMRKRWMTRVPSTHLSEAMEHHTELKYRMITLNYSDVGIIMVATILLLNLLSCILVVCIDITEIVIYVNKKLFHI